MSEKKNSKYKKWLHIAFYSILMITTLIQSPIWYFTQQSDVAESIHSVGGRLKKGHYILECDYLGNLPKINSRVIIEDGAKLIIPKGVTVEFTLPLEFPSDEYFIFNVMEGGFLDWSGNMKLLHHKNLTSNIASTYDNLEITLASGDGEFIVNSLVSDSPNFQNYCGHCISIESRQITHLTVDFLVLNNRLCDLEYFTLVQNSEPVNHITLVNGYCALEYIQDIRIYKIISNDFDGKQLVNFEIESDKMKNELKIYSDIFDLKNYHNEEFIVLYKGEPVYHDKTGLDTFYFNEPINIFDGDMIISNSDDILITDEVHVIPYDKVSNYPIKFEMKLHQEFIDDDIPIDDLDILFKFNDVNVQYVLEDGKIIFSTLNYFYDIPNIIEFQCAGNGILSADIMKEITFIKGIKIEITWFNIDTFTYNILINHHFEDVSDNLRPENFYLMDKNMILSDIMTHHIGSSHIKQEEFSFIMPTTWEDLYWIRYYHSTYFLDDGKLELDYSSHFTNLTPSITQYFIDVRLTKTKNLIIRNLDYRKVGPTEPEDKFDMDLEIQINEDIFEKVLKMNGYINLDISSYIVDDIIVRNINNYNYDYILYSYSKINDN